MPTIKELAQRAGVSISAVSAVFNKHPEMVSAATRHLILTCAIEMGYRTYDANRLLASGKHETIALVFPSMGAIDFQHQMVTKLMQGVGNVATRSGLKVLLCFSEPFEGLGPSLQRLSTQQVDGAVVVGPLSKNIDVLKAMDDLHFPTVCFDCYRGFKNIGTVDGDMTGEIKTVVQRLLAIGHRKIMYLSGAPFIHAYVERLEGYMEAMREAALPIDDGSLRIIPEQYPQAIINKLFDSGELPDAIICGTDMAFHVCWSKAMEHNIKVPEQLSITIMNSLPQGHPSGDCANYVTPNLLAWGESATHMLMDMIAEKDDITRLIRIPAVITING